MSPQVEAIRDQVDEILRKRGILRASLFGSIVRGHFTNESDIDFLFEFEKGRSLLDLAGLQLELTAALSREVDVATLKALHPTLRDAILAECIRIL